MKRLLGCSLVILLLFVSVNSVFAWTTHPFILGSSDVYSGQDHWKTWHITSMQERSHDSTDLKYMFKYRVINQITITRSNGKEEIHANYSKEFFIKKGQGEMYDLAITHLREIADLIETQVDTNVMAVSSIIEIQSINIFLDSKYDRNKEIHYKLMKFLNEERTKRIQNKTFVVDQKTKRFLDNL